MAVVPIPTLVPAEEYFNSSYRPDVEYVDGVLVERGAPTIAHGFLQALLSEYFRRYRKQFHFAVLSETRTQIAERARYRIPDVMLCPIPLPSGGIVNSIPWAVFEILSPDDKVPDMLARFRDHQQLGASHVVLLDPEQFVAFRYENGSLMQTKFTSLELPTGALAFDTEALFRQLAEELNEGATLS